jgi:hypothetical protein
MQYSRFFLPFITTLTLTGCISGGGGSSTVENSGETTGSSSNTSFIQSKQSSGYVCNSTEDTCYLLTVTSSDTLSGTYESCTISTEACTSTPLRTYVTQSQANYVKGVYAINNASLDSCSVDAGVYTCFYSDSVLTHVVKSRLQYDNLSYSVTHSYSSKNWRAAKEDEGYNCSDNISCIKADIVDNKYNGTIEQCVIATKACNPKVTIYEYAKGRIQESASSFTPAVTVSDCRFTTESYYACLGDKADGGKEKLYMDLSPLSTNGFLSTSRDYSTPSTQELQINQEFGQQSIYPDFNITKPASWRTLIPELSNILDTSDDWNKGHLQHNTNFTAQRGAVCSESLDQFSIECFVGVEYGQYYQCEKYYTAAERVCNVYYSEPPVIKNLMDSQLAFHGFDVEEEENFTYSETYPVVIADRNCEIDHTLVKNNVRSAKMFFENDRVFNLNLSNQEDRNLLRWTVKPTSAWAGVEGGSHCASVTALITANNGAPLQIVINADTEVSKLPEIIPKGSLLGVSQGQMNYGVNLAATKSFNSLDYFSIWAGGNGQQNYTEELSVPPLTGQPEYDFVWGTNFQEQLLFVGAVDADGVKISSSAQPGTDTQIQSRWIMALGRNVITATSTAYGQSAIYKTSGTSFAQPFVTRALAKGKNLCPSSTYSDLSNVLLNTAKRDFDGYDPALYGRGILDVAAFTESLDAQCPSNSQAL